MIATKQSLISAIYKILLIFEDCADCGSNVTVEDYLRYLNRLYIRFTGYGNAEILDTINGLILLETRLTHREVKSTVFHMIDILQKEE